MTNLNQYPYYDDFDPSKGYHKILFHPAKPVQARELTQIQSIIQEQIKRNGDHMFKNGTVVIPGHVFYDNKVKYIKLQAALNQVNANDYIEQLIGKTVVGANNGISAIIAHAEMGNGTTEATLFVKYTNSAGVVKEFASGETLTCAALSNLQVRVAAITAYTGNGSIASISEGVYYINGYFVGVSAQTVAVSAYSDTPSNVVGLIYTESIVTENEDESLHDNAFGFTNYGAPGAHRLKISLTLAVKPYNYVAADVEQINFIDVLRVKAGQIEYLKNNTKYAEIEKWLARRTYEESGNYVVKPFKFRSGEYRNNNRGIWAANTVYLVGDVINYAANYYVSTQTGYSGTVAPVHAAGIVSDGNLPWLKITNTRGWVNGGRNAPYDNILANHLANEALMVVYTSAGKGYINGFEVEIPTEVSSIVNKARTTKQINNTQIYTPTGSHVLVSRLRGQTNISTNLTQVTLKNIAGTTVGTAYVRNVEFSNGSMATPDTIQYRVFLFDVKIVTGYTFAKDAHSMIATGVFSAVIEPSSTKLSGAVSATIGTAAVTGSGTSFDTDLKVGQRILVGTEWKQVLTIASPQDLTVTSNFAATQTNASIYSAFSNMVKDKAYVVKVNDAMATIRDSAGGIDTTYVINKVIPFTAAGTSITLPALTNGETFLPPSDHYVVADSGTLETNTILNNVDITLSPDSTQLTITNQVGPVTGILVAAANYKINVQVRRSGAFAKEKTKMLATKTIIVNNAGTYQSDNVTLIQANGTFRSSILDLTEGDAIRISSIKMSGAVDPVTYNATGETDITSWYKFNDGQTDEYYGMSTITATRIPSRPIKVTFEYFNHTDGDYFSVDSYSSVPPQMLPTFRNGSGELMFLADCLDFRSRIADNGVGFNVANGAAVSEPISSESTINTSYSFYLPREDHLSLSTEGKIVYKEGGKVQEGVELATVFVNPYTQNPAKDVAFDDIQVRNYSMEDIGALNSRVAAVEYYVSLSLLEQDAATMSVKDEFGLERTKYGFVVDEFKEHTVGDITHPDYKCSIDEDNRVLRAMCTKERVTLIEPYGSNPAARAAKHYQVTGDVASLPYIEEVVVSQRIFSQSEPIQAFTSISYSGKVNVFPNKDMWSDNVTSLQRVNTKTTTTETRHTQDTYTVTSYVYSNTGVVKGTSTTLNSTLISSTTNTVKMPTTVSKPIPLNRLTYNNYFINRFNRRYTW